MNGPPGVYLYVRASPSVKYLNELIPEAASELTAAAVILQFWTQALQTWHWALIIIIPMFALQCIHVKVYGLFRFSVLVAIIELFRTSGESEYWFAMVKVIMIVFFIIVGLIFDWGGVKGHPGPVLCTLIL